MTVNDPSPSPDGKKSRGELLSALVYLLLCSRITESGMLKSSAVGLPNRSFLIMKFSRAGLGLLTQPPALESSPSFLPPRMNASLRRNLEPPF